MISQTQNRDKSIYASRSRYLGFLVFWVAISLVAQACPTPASKPAIKYNQGGLTSEEIRDVIVKNLNQIRACYETELKPLPAAPQYLKVRFEIGKLGQVKSIKVLQKSSELGSVAQCSVSSIVRWKFPAPRDTETVRVTYPFYFSKS